MSADAEPRDIYEGVWSAEENAAWLRGQAAKVVCPTGKQVHMTKQEARNHIMSVTSRLKDKSRTAAFVCGYCGFWHIGRRR